MKYLPNFLIISGTGRNVGKTTLSCKIIDKFSNENRITALKITNHFHDIDQKTSKIIYESESYKIIEELNILSNKDTSRFLQAGANNSFMIMSDLNNLATAINRLEMTFGFDTSIFIVESMSIREIITPAYSILVTNDLNIKSSTGFDIVAHFNSENLTYDLKIEDFKIVGKEWKIK